jgi:hypothetical protein
MDQCIDPRGLAGLRTRPNRRDLLGFAATGAASTIVTQSLISCASDSVAGTDHAGTGSGTAGTTPACMPRVPERRRVCGDELGVQVG